MEFVVISLLFINYNLWMLAKLSYPASHLMHWVKPDYGSNWHVLQFVAQVKHILEVLFNTK